MSTAPSTPEDRFAMLVDELISNPDVTPPERGHAFGASALKTHGKVFAMLSKGKLVLKLPKPRVDALVADAAGERFDPRRDGRVMKEWVVIDSTSDDVWLSLAQEAMAFVGAQA